MAFGRDPQNHPQTSSFFVQCAACAGTDSGSDAISVGESKGRLEDQIHRSLGWFASLGRREVYREILREDNREGLERALREALVNAVIHREYAITGSTGAVRSLQRPNRRHQPGRPSQSHGGGERFEPEAAPVLETSRWRMRWSWHG